MREVGEDLGNTAAVARASYVDPRLVDLYEDGVTVSETIAARDLSQPAARAAAERAVLKLLSS